MPVEEDDYNAVYLPDLMQTWSFASQSNDESLLSAVPGILALLLKTLSGILKLSGHGLRLCRTLLQKQQLELIARGLTASKGKEFLISPALRLLKELTTFDGGALAKQVFRARDQTFRSLARNLSLRYNGEGVEDWRKPSVRTNALRFLLSSIKFLPTEARRELLNQRDIVSNITRDIKNDPPYMVREILETLKTHVLQDDALPRDAKTKVVNATSLGRIALLYRYDQPEEESSTVKQTVDTLAHEFLVVACTSPDLGVLNRQAGFYPRGIDPDDIGDADIDHAHIDLGLDSIEWVDKFAEKIPVRNTILSDFIQTLRPWSSTKQSELLLSILRCAPELIADYFFGKKAFGFEPKLTATWIGYAAFIFSALQLPIPKFFGHKERYARLPPPSSIVLESILPQPLSQKVLTRCLNQSHNLITFFAIRLLCMSFTKLKDTLKMYQEAATGLSSVWTQAAEKLTDEFCRRCPSIKDVINTFRNLPAKDLMQKEAVTKLLVLYYEVVPRIAVDAKFDVSRTLTQTLQALDDPSLTSEDRAMRAMGLENLFQFAHFSPGMRWFAKSEGLSISPFSAMLKLSAEAPSDIPLLKLRSVLGSVVEENEILQTRTSASALDSAILGLKTLQGTVNEGAVYAFLDDCASRCAAKPTKYIFALEEIHSEVHGSDEAQSPVSLLTLAIVEQWPFLVKSVDDMVLQDVAQFVARHLAASIKMKEDKKVLKTVIQKLATDTPEASPSRKIIERTRKLVDDVVIPESKKVLPQQADRHGKSKAPSEIEKEEVSTEMLERPNRDIEDHSALIKWTSKEADEVVEGGYAAALIMLLSSSHLNVRKESVVNISKFAAKLKESSVEEKEQIWLLLSEVVETAKKVIDQERLSTIISSFASHAIIVLNDPLHCLYPKINKFLSQGPTWELDKIPLMYKILEDAPSLDDAHYSEVSFLLTYMLDGLHTSADMAIYRKRRVFEKLLSLWNSAYLAPGVRDTILKILFRATTIEGGSTTLITRFSSMTWLQAQVALGGGIPLKVLVERILESCDQKRVGTWSRGGSSVVKVDTLNF
jgi:nucleolar pre-ribosomal-associated protein 1